MTMTTCAHTHAHTLDALTEEADTINNLRQTAAKQALSNRRWTSASVSQFQGFTAHDPPSPSLDSRCSVSANLCNSVQGGYYADPDMHCTMTLEMVLEMVPQMTPEMIPGIMMTMKMMRTGLMPMVS